MFVIMEISYLSILEAAASSVLSALLLLAVSRFLWTLRWKKSRDRRKNLPLPKGSMGWPFFGETLHWLVQGSDFHSSRREKYGNVFKTHLLGKPVIRVTGAENIRKILLGEHNLVRAQWPQSTQIILGSNTLLSSIGEFHRQRRKIMAKMFSRSALESYIPRIQEAVSSELHGWCTKAGPVAVYSAAKALTFRIAVRVLLGLSIEEKQFKDLEKTFEQLAENLFSLPLDIPFSGLRKGIKARDTLHELMEKVIAEKLQKGNSEGSEDALDFIINSAKEHGKEVSIQELKESAIELIFAAFFTTASASTSLILLLLKHPTALQKIRQELESLGINKQCHCLVSHVIGNKLNHLKSFHEVMTPEQKSLNNGHQLHCARPDVSQNTQWEQFDIISGETIEGGPLLQSSVQRDHVLASRTQEDLNYENRNRESQRLDWSRLVSRSQELAGDEVKLGSACECRDELSLEKLNCLRYLDCVVKEVLRLLPPVSGGYRTALQTFELDGYQIPKGWSVMYSIRDTHETAAVYQNSDLFDPDRFSSERDQSKWSRFNYIPFGGGVRSCIGKELAKVILKTLAVELAGTAKWELATPSFPKMQTVPIVHPVDGLQLYFHFLGSCTGSIVSQNA
ncbi:cytochrome P450 26C1 isoform X1 [Microcaecilia unicolor]|uniref:Cytochrome P450 26C1 isoform X1 n=1 Tax=Microcaecilia unicolor TaxID=1415580 RepID=A0A6P7Y235_9AMPH|nr:cytochrome P450 26C1 isoform X1 [Microcaecilia unicolor]XP_030058881.1 cytochrome P450 26C1 isoform X1 [Microcaecilia unicolor]XP_030058882.1 cytochrome P450 26C1 isoform X1 [Microcaecilia unicolor]XP_030058883.1 cytochrome P450 26C1 isoform X1 [Microcaecilia unicolor]